MLWVTGVENRLRAIRDRVPECQPKEKKVTKIVVTCPKEETKDKNRMVNEKVNYQKKVTDGIKIYPNAQAAGDAIIKQNKISGFSPKKAAIKIVAAIVFEKEYFGKKWTFVEEE